MFTSIWNPPGQHRKAAMQFVEVEIVDAVAGKRPAAPVAVGIDEAFADLVA